MADLNDVRYRMDEEGFDYCFRFYSNFDEVKDKEFHKLRRKYLSAAEALEEYVKLNSKGVEDDELI